MSRQTCKRWKYSAKKTQRIKVYVIAWDYIELYVFILHKCMILRRFGVEIVRQPIPKILQNLQKVFFAIFYAGFSGSGDKNV